MTRLRNPYADTPMAELRAIEKATREELAERQRRLARIRRELRHRKSAGRTVHA